MKAAAKLKVCLRMRRFLLCSLLTTLPAISLNLDAKSFGPKPHRLRLLLKMFGNVVRRKLNQPFAAETVQMPVRLERHPVITSHAISEIYFLSYSNLTG